MAYRNKTFVSFASEDINQYWLMTAWNKNQNFEFNFHDAHDINTARDTSSAETIEKRLSERLANTKQVVLLLSENAKRKADDGQSFIHHEVMVMKRMGLPIVFVNLNGSRNIQHRLIPKALTEAYTLSVTFQPKIIMKALDAYVDYFYSHPDKRQIGPHYYMDDIYSNLGL